MKDLMENWRGYLNEGPKLLDPPLKNDPKSIETIGQLHDYYMSKEPGQMKKLGAKYGRTIAKGLAGLTVAAASTGVGAPVAGATGVAGAIASAGADAIAEKVIEELLMAAVVTFANVEDGSYKAGSIASYFDLDDHLTMFLRDLETQGKQITKPSKPELEAYGEIRKKVQDAITSGASPKTKISDLLKDLTAQAILDDRIKTGEYSGKVDVRTIG